MELQFEQGTEELLKFANATVVYLQRVTLSFSSIQSHVDAWQVMVGCQQGDACNVCMSSYLRVLHSTAPPQKATPLREPRQHVIAACVVSTSAKTPANQ